MKGVDSGVKLLSVPVPKPPVVRELLPRKDGGGDGRQRGGKVRVTRKEKTRGPDSDEGLSELKIHGGRRNRSHLKRKLKIDRRGKKKYEQEL